MSASRRSRPRPVALVALLAGALGLAACGGGSDEATTTTTTAPSTTTAPAPAAGPAGPLTGLPVDEAHANRPALVVKIDNAPKARPQAGLNEADVVVEEGVEGGVTRFAVIFHSQDAAAIGPVRSARSTDILIARALGRPLFAYSGANAVFAGLLKASPLLDVGVGRVAAAYHREKGRPGPYDLFSTTPPLFAAAPPEATAPPALFPFRAAGEGPPAAYETARRVQALWKDKVETRVVYEWDAAAAGFARTTNGTAHVDAAGSRVAPQNVVFQLVPYRNTGLVDRSGAAVPEAELVGEGEVLVLTAGKMVRGRWSKPAPEAVTSYVDGAGAPIRLTPGRTWVELVPTGMLEVAPG